MAKLKDNFYNRVIEGELDAEEEISSGAVKAVEGAESGTIDSALGLDSNGKLVKGTINGGTKLYKHHLTGVSVSGGPNSFDVISIISTKMEVVNGVLSTKSVFADSNMISCGIDAYGKLLAISQDGVLSCSAQRLSAGQITVATITFTNDFNDEVTQL